MRRYTDASIDRLRDAVDIVEIVSQRVELRKVGAELVGLCPFHEERTPSFNVNPGKRVFLCRGCGKGGDAITFVENVEDIDFRAAVELLADRYRVDLEHDGDDGRHRPASSRPAPVIDGTWPAAVLDRLRELRGWTPEAIRRLGLTLSSDRVAFPVHDDAGRFLGHVRYQPNPDKRDERNRKMLADKGVPRALFPAPERVTGDPLWLVEGEPDAVAAHSVGIPAVGIPGTQGWKAEWAPRFKGRSVVICTDCDDEGRKLAAAVATDLADYAKEIRVLDLGASQPKGYDLTDAALEHRDHYGDLRRMLFDIAAEIEPIKAADPAAQLGGRRLQDWQDIMLRRVRGEEPPEAGPIPLPFDELNEAMNGGLRPGQVIIVGGWTGHNKSNFADMMLDSAAAAGRSAHLYATEMPLGDRGDRYLARHSGVPFGRLRSGRLQPAERERAERAIAAMRWPALLISDWSPEQVCEDILQCGWGLAVIDHLHDFPYRREEDLRAIVQLFATTARTSTKNGPGTCVVLVSQLNDGQMTGSRSNERPPPGMHSLKGTSAIKQVADEVFFVWMEDDENGRATTSGRVWNVKGRMNGTAAVSVSLNVDRMTLESDAQWRPHAAGGYVVDPEAA